MFQASHPKTLAISALLTLFLAQPVEASATHQENASTPHVDSTLVASGFGGHGRPRSRTSGGARGGCADYLIALVPGDGEVAVDTGDCVAQSAASPTLTSTNSPTFWFYLSELSTPGVMGEFVLLDENEQPILVEQVALPDRSGIIAVQPSQPLEVDRTYAWIFSVVLNPRSPSQNPAVEGIVQVVTPEVSLSTQLAATTSETEQVAIYQQHQIWQDAVTKLAELRCADPQNATLASSWSNLLQSVGLGAIENAPLLTCSALAEETATAQ